MIPAHVRRTIVFSATAFFLVLQFQNCAPVKKTTRTGDDPNASSPVHAIDYSSPGALTFQQQKLEIAPQAESASVRALCSLSLANAILEWKLLDPSGGPDIISGAAECINGRLQVDIEPAQMLACNIVYKLAVATSNQSAQSVNLERFCPEQQASNSQ